VLSASSVSAPNQTSTTATLVSALVISRLDYGNAALAGLPHSSTAPLQRVLNSAAQLVCGLRPLDHVTEALINLHWLPVTGRIEFKLCVLVLVSQWHRTVIHR